MMAHPVVMAQLRNVRVLQAPALSANDPKRGLDEWKEIEKTVEWAEVCDDLSFFKRGRCIRLEIKFPTANTARYSVSIVDAVKKAERLCGVFIVPQGREGEWLFSSREGQVIMAGNSGFRRLIFVALNRGHTFASLDAVKHELSPSMLSFAPERAKASSSAPIPFLTVEEGLGSRHRVAEISSELSGAVLVEDVCCPFIKDARMRRLIFLASRHLVQSEVLLVPRTAASSSSRFTPIDSVGCLDHAHLACGYAKSLVGGMVLTPTLPRTALLLGLGAGSLAMFLVRALPRLQLTAVELDPAVVQLARRSFALEKSERLHVELGDAVKHVHSLAAQEGRKHDFILLDVNNPKPGEGISYPAPAFLEKRTLQALHACLAPDGVLALNLCSRSAPLRQRALKALCCEFDTVFLVSLPHDVNKAVFACNASSHAKHLVAKALRARALQLAQKDRKVGMKDAFRLSVDWVEWADSLQVVEATEGNEGACVKLSPLFHQADAAPPVAVAPERKTKPKRRRQRKRRH